MDKHYKQKIMELLEFYFKGHENAIIKLTEINSDYYELLPMIKEITDQKIEKNRAEAENYYNEKLDEFKKDYSKDYNKLKRKMEKITELSRTIIEDKKELSDLLGES